MDSIHSCYLKYCVPETSKSLSPAPSYSNLECLECPPICASIKLNMIKPKLLYLPTTCGSVFPAPVLGTTTHPFIQAKNPKE